MSSHPWDYETLIEDSLVQGSDMRGRYSEADFSCDSTFVSVVKRPDSYAVSWTVDRDIEDLYNTLQMFYDAEDVVKAEDANSDSLWFDPDAWNGEGHENLNSVEVPYEDFSVHFNQYTISEAEMLDQRFCDVALASRESRFKQDRNLFFEAAPILHPFLTDDIVDPKASRKVFDDVKSYLEKPI